MSEKEKHTETAGSTGPLKSVGIPVLNGGEKQVKDLRVNWQCAGKKTRYPVADCVVRLGSQTFRCRLDRNRPSRDFILFSGKRAAWGSLALSGLGTAFGALMLTCGIGDMEVLSHQPSTLHRWRLCPDDRTAAPETGSLAFGPGKAIKATWTVDGADTNCKGVRVRFFIHDKQVAAPGLSEDKREWQDTLVADGICAQCALTYLIEPGDVINLKLDCRWVDAEIDIVELETWHSGRGPCPDRKCPGEVLVGARTPAEILSCLAAPVGLVLPTREQLANRFIDICNTTAFQKALSDKPAVRDRIAEAMAFMDPDSKSYPGQFVSKVGDLPLPMGNLCGRRFRALFRHQERPNDFVGALTDILGVSLDAFVTDKTYKDSKNRVQNSVVALAVSCARYGQLPDRLIRVLIICHLAEQVRHPSVLTQARLSELLSAACVLPVFPCNSSSDQMDATPGTTAYARTLGAAELQVLRHRLNRYEPGELAHIENLMPGEQRQQEQTQRFEHKNAQLEETRLDLDTSQYHGQSGTSDLDNRILSNPGQELTRNFAKLNNKYGSDGLTQTITGGWSDTLSPAEDTRSSVRHRAMDMLNKAAKMVSKQVKALRYRSLEAELISRQQCRQTNENRDRPLIGMYRWIDQVFAISLQSMGQRLFLEFVLSAPADGLIEREGALHGVDLTPPPPPVVKAGTGERTLKPCDITRDNYRGFLEMYGVKKGPFPPPQIRLFSAALSQDPPHNADSIEIPPDYSTKSARISFAVTLEEPARPQGGKGGLAIMIGPSQKTVDLKSAPVSGTFDLEFTWPSLGDTGESSLPEKEGSTLKQGFAGSARTRLFVAVLAPAGYRYCVNIIVQTSCSDAGKVFGSWQHQIWRRVMTGYERELKNRKNTLENLLIGSSPLERLGALERETLKKKAIECLVNTWLNRPGVVKETTGWKEDAMNFRLVPFFSGALAWPDMSFTYYPTFFGPDALDRPFLYVREPSASAMDDFTAFLRAGSARLVVPVRPGYDRALLYFLSSRGCFWFGSADLTPVWDRDVDLVNQLKTQDPVPEPETAAWEVRVATPMIRLQDGDQLPSFMDNIRLPAGGKP